MVGFSHVLDRYSELSSNTRAFWHLAMRILQWWDNVVFWCYNGDIRKHRSHHGAIPGIGDPGNYIYWYTVQACIFLRRVCNQPRLDAIEGLGVERTGDVLEGILGVAWLHPLGGVGVDEARDVVIAAARHVHALEVRQWEARQSLLQVDQIPYVLGLEQEVEAHRRAYMNHQLRVSTLGIIRLAMKWWPKPVKFLIAEYIDWNQHQ